MKKRDLPAVAPRFQEGHIVTFAVTVISGLISALALGYHIYTDATMSEPVKWAFIALGSLFAFGMAMTPISLARAHGESMDGGNPQTGLLFIVMMIMFVDGALQVHAASFLIKEMGMGVPSIWFLVAGAALMQIALFFVRGLLYGASKEIQEMIDGRKHEAEMLQINIRARLEQQATELGIGFDGRTSNSILQSKIHQRRLHAVA